MYFKEQGIQNTKETLQLAIKAAKERGIKHIVLATTEGSTPDALENTEGLNIVIVTHAYGSREKGVNSLSEEKRQAYIDKGYKVCTAAHTLSGVERAITTKFGGIYPAEIIANTLRLFGQGTKVCVEIAAMAADGGYVPPFESIIAIGGSSRGADTALILRTAYSSTILDTKVDEIICKPIEK